MTNSSRAAVWGIALGRALNALFFLCTSVYCLLTYSPFAYEQFIQPHVVAWLSNFVLLHADFYWLALCVTVLTLAPGLKASQGSSRALSASKGLAWAYIAVGAAVGAVITFKPILPGGGQPRRSLTLALVSLIPIAWLAVVDHLAVRRDERHDDGTPDESRVLLAAAYAALLVWITYGAAAAARLRGGGAAVSGASLLVGWISSAVAHAAAFTVVFLTIVAIGRFASLDSTPRRSQYWSGALVAAAALTVVLQRVVFAPISVGGGASWTLSSAMAAALVLCVAGISRYRGSSRGFPIAAAVTLAVMPLAAFLALSAVTTFDWGFMLQKLSALAVASIAFVCLSVVVRYRSAKALRSSAVSRSSEVSRSIALPIAVMIVYGATAFAAPRVPRWLNDPRLDPEFALDSYSAGDPSFRMLRQFLTRDQSPQTDAEFYAYLRANSSIKADVKPAPVDFVRRFAPATAPPPHIFLFLIDSLRRDYVAPYNPAVTFTPQLEAFAADSFVFDRAFSRYGGTGLAVPSIWAGAMVVHKQYVTPFAPMNALAKLLDAAGYQRMITFDHITDELFGFTPETTTLDRNVPEMMHTFCGTVDDMKRALLERAGDRRPVFAHTRPLDLHIGNTRLAPVPAGESYPGFFGPYAAKVRRIDACFGDFIAFLKRAQRYDDSVIIVTSDHGDSLGEGLRWGHGYTVFPEVIRIPLLIHLPARMRERVTTDLARVSFGTDITPTLYALLGQNPIRPRSVAGVPLFNDDASPPAPRRDESFLVASSYGAVYGLVGHNGRRLYIADAIEGRDYLYDLGPTTGDVRIALTDAERAASRASIRQQVGELAAWYGFR